MTENSQAATVANEPIRTLFNTLTGKVNCFANCLTSKNILIRYTDWLTDGWWCTYDDVQSSSKSVGPDLPDGRASAQFQHEDHVPPLLLRLRLLLPRRPRVTSTSTTCRLRRRPPVARMKIDLDDRQRGALSWRRRRQRIRRIGGRVDISGHSGVQVDDVHISANNNGIAS